MRPPIVVCPKLPSHVHAAAYVFQPFNLSVVYLTTAPLRHYRNFSAGGGKIRTNRVVGPRQAAPEA
jgi:hypothetical protein